MPSLGGTGTPPLQSDGLTGEYNLAIKHGETSITVEGATEADDVEFMQAKDFGDGRTMHVRTDGMRMKTATWSRRW